MRTLEVRDVSFTYGKGTPVLEHVSLSVAGNERVALCAPSGAGKTTLCKIMAGYLQPTQGEVKITSSIGAVIQDPSTSGAHSAPSAQDDGEKRHAAAPSVIPSGAGRTPLSVIPSGAGRTPLSVIPSGAAKGRVVEGSHIEKQAQPAATLASRRAPNPVQLIWQHPELACDPRMRMGDMLREAGELDEELLDALGVKPAWLSRFPRELSGGELQRCCIARALRVRPEFIIADEMTTMLDAVTQAQVWHVLIEHCEREGVGLVLVTHSPELEKQLATRVFEL